MNIYFISGLGVDYRAFLPMEKAISEEFPNANFFPVHWITPEKKDNIFSYCSKLGQQIKHEEYILIGLSSGGLCAQVISKIKPPLKLILISSFIDHSDFPNSFKVLKAIKSSKIVPLGLAKKYTYINNYIFGVKSEDGRTLLKKIIKDTDSKIFHWSLDQIINWNPKEEYSIDLHIIGNQDKIVPYHHGQNVKIVDGGGHFMIFEMVDEIYPEIRALLLELPK